MASPAIGGADGEHHDHADLAQAVRDLPRSPRDDHAELFDRVVFSLAFGNTDDHGYRHQRG